MTVPLSVDSEKRASAILMAFIIPLMFQGCSPSFIPWSPAKHQRPQLNPTPHSAIHIYITSDPTIDTGVTAVYLATHDSPECFERLTIDAGWPLGVEDKAPASQDSLHAKIFTVSADKYLSGHCEWRFRRVNLTVIRRSTKKTDSESVDNTFLKSGAASLKISMLCGDRIYNPARKYWTNSNLYCTADILSDPFRATKERGDVHISVRDNDLSPPNYFPVSNPSGGTSQ